jgi:hypothetical protein
MAESKDNIITFGLSGLIGRLLVFRTREGRTFVSKRPKATTIPPTADQILVRERFSDAITYAKAAITDPATREMYAHFAKPLQSAFNVAMANFSSIPEVQLINVEAYTGSIGSKITVKATDDCKVDRVRVVIKTGAGVIVEQGNAVAQPNGLDWAYTATTLNASLPGCVVTATVYNLPGNNSNSNKTL